MWELWNKTFQDYMNINYTKTWALCTQDLLPRVYNQDEQAKLSPYQLYTVSATLTEERLLKAEWAVQKAFVHLKQDFITAPLLDTRKFPWKSFIIKINASEKGRSAILKCWLGDLPKLSKLQETVTSSTEIWCETSARSIASSHIYLGSLKSWGIYFLN